MPVPLIAVAAAGAGLWWFLNSKRPANSALENAPESQYQEGVAEECQDLVSSCLGWPYFYGQGGPATPWDQGKAGVDCSGLVQMCAVQDGQLSASSPDRGATDLANASDPIAVGQQQPGDFACYPGHIAYVVGHPNPEQGYHSAILSASGGTRTTNGNDPNARVKLFDSGAYRGDFLTYARLRR